MRGESRARSIRLSQRAPSHTLAVACPPSPRTFWSGLFRVLTVWTRSGVVDGTPCGCADLRALHPAWLFREMHVAMETAPNDDLTDDERFVLRTHAALTELKLDADKVLRNLPARHACPDLAPCRGCEALRLIHLRIDDHLNQLESANLLAAH